MSLTTKFDEALAAMEASTEAKEKAISAQCAARSAEDDAITAVVTAFVDEYERLPVDVKNKVRHRINAAKIP